MQITDLVINGTVKFIKRYPEYVLEKVGTVISIHMEDGTVLVRTDNRTIYKIIFMDVEFYMIEQ
jgi:hypothetical protein